MLILIDPLLFFLGFDPVIHTDVDGAQTADIAKKLLIWDYCRLNDLVSHALDVGLVHWGWQGPSWINVKLVHWIRGWRHLGMRSWSFWWFTFVWLVNEIAYLSLRQSHYWFSAYWIMRWVFCHVLKSLRLKQLIGGFVLEMINWWHILLVRQLWRLLDT